jgi:hypothetical protein
MNYRIAGNFCGVQFSWKASLQSFRGLISQTRAFMPYNRTYFAGLTFADSRISVKTTTIGTHENFPLYGNTMNEANVPNFLLEVEGVEQVPECSEGSPSLVVVLGGRGQWVEPCTAHFYLLIYSAVRCPRSGCTVVHIAKLSLQGFIEGGGTDSFASPPPNINS